MIQINHMDVVLVGMVKKFANLMSPSGIREPVHRATVKRSKSKKCGHHW